MNDVTNEAALVPMTRDAPQFPGGPVEARVHPDEVGNYLAGGWAAPPGFEGLVQSTPSDKPLDAMTLPELRGVADAEGVQFFPRTPAAKLIADILRKRSEEADHG